MNFTVLVLSGSYKETGIQTRGLVSAAGKEGFRFDHFYLKTEALIKKKEPQKILIDCRHDFAPAVFSGLEEIRERFEALRSSGKEVFFYAPSYGVQELYLAAACSYRLIHPMGTIKFFGMSQSFMFAKRIMRKLGIDTEIFRRGEYKSAGDTFGRDNLADPNKEQYENFLKTVMHSVRSSVITGFEKSEDDLSELENGRILSAEQAEDASWIDEIVTLNDFRHRWEEQKDKEVRFRNVPKKAGGRFFLPEQRIAVLVFEGAVVDGHSRRDLFLGQAVGAETFIPQIRKLRENKKVKAVVLRINSGGGSAFASEDITAELRLLAGKKPLIVSMSEVAGSGGYWMSCCGRKTFALPNSLTGSIGVISIYFGLHRMFEKTGIIYDTITTGDFADTGSPYRRMTETEKEMLDSDIEKMYGNFVSMVSDARKMTEDQVDAVAGGRVWPGSEACSIGLVDAQGGLNDALSEAAAAAGLKHPTVRFYPEIRRGFVERIIMSFSKEDDETAEAAGILSEIRGAFSNISSFNTGPLAIMEEAVFRWN